MSEDKKFTNNQAGKGDAQGANQGVNSQGAAKTVAKDVYGEKKRSFRGGKRGDRRDERRDEFEQRILEIARVTRVMAGGKRMNFRACVAIGDRKGSVGVGLGKGADVTMAVNKAVNKAKKKMVNVPVVNDTIPHEVYIKKGAAKIMIKPAKKGRGVISGGVTRVIFELAGVKNVTTKTLGTNNKINNARCTIEALTKLRKIEKKADKVEGEEVKKDQGQEVVNSDKK